MQQAHTADVKQLQQEVEVLLLGTLIKHICYIILLYLIEKYMYLARYVRTFFVEVDSVIVLV